MLFRVTSGGLSASAVRAEQTMMATTGVNRSTPEGAEADAAACQQFEGGTHVDTFNCRGRDRAGDRRCRRRHVAERMRQPENLGSCWPFRVRTTAGSSDADGRALLGEVRRRTARIQQPDATPPATSFSGMCAAGSTRLRGHACMHALLTNLFHFSFNKQFQPNRG